MHEMDDDVKYSQWDSTDRTALRTHTTPVEEFIGRQYVIKEEELKHTNSVENLK